MLSGVILQIMHDETAYLAIYVFSFVKNRNRVKNIICRYIFDVLMNSSSIPDRLCLLSKMYKSVLDTYKTVKDS